MNQSATSTYNDAMAASSRHYARLRKPLDVEKLKHDLQVIMGELSNESSKDMYSPTMWIRLQKTTDYVVTAINAVRLRLSGMTCREVAAKLHLKPQQVAAFSAWNTMYQPGWPERNRLRKVKELERQMEMEGKIL